MMNEDVERLYLNDVEKTNSSLNYTNYLNSINMTLFVERTQPTILLKDCYFGTYSSHHSVDCTEDECGPIGRNSTIILGVCEGG